MAITDAFPGVSGTVDSTELRKNLAGLIVRDSSGVPRAGIFPRTTASLLTARADLFVDVAAFEGVSVRGGGPLFMANDGVVQAGPFPAPTANSRIDVVYFKQNESTPPFGDASNLPIIGVLAGTPAAVPTKPSIAGIAGAEEIGTVLMLAGKTATNQTSVVITPTHRFTSTAGGVLNFRTVGERDAWAAVTGQPSFCLDTDAGYIKSATGWLLSSEPNRVRAWRFPRVGGDSDSFGAGSFASVAGGTIANAPAGDYLISATAVVTNTAVNVGYMRVNAGGVNLSADMRLDVGGNPLPHSYTDVLKDFPGGSLVLDLSVLVAGGTGTVMKNGTGIRAVYLGRS